MIIKTAMVRRIEALEGKRAQGDTFKAILCTSEEEISAAEIHVANHPGETFYIISFAGVDMEGNQVMNLNRKFLEVGL